MNDKALTHHRHGFTLIELSMVLIIIGLVIGGVFIGKSLVHAAELRSVITATNGYITAVSNFRSQYRGMPGDILNASSYWGAATNGDADGNIAGAERFQFWYQLNMAGFVDKSFTGAQGAGGSEDFVLGSNVPSSRLTGSGFSAYYANIAASTTTYAVNMKNMITYGAGAGTNAGAPINAFLTPTDAYTIDTKVDDGIPGTGQWIANLTGGGVFGSATACSTDASGSVYAGTYNVSSNVIACSFFVMTGY